MDMERSVTFSVKNHAFSPDSINSDVWNLILSTFPIFEVNYNTYCSVKNNIFSMDLSNYYTYNGSGAKVTKAIKKVFSSVLSKDDFAMIDTKYPLFCKYVAELYAPQMSIKAFFAKKEDIGDGIWERSVTCFASDGCNYTSKLFIKKFKRTQFLVLHDVENNKSARCILFFAGNRRVHLTNFYFNGLQNNTLLFVEAVKRMFTLDKISFKATHDFPLPIYSNGDGIECYDKRSKPKSKPVLKPCPHCDTKVFTLVNWEDGNTWHIGCCDECADTDKEGCCCTNCQEQYNDHDEGGEAPDGEPYCGGCYDEYIAYCPVCSESVWRRDMIGDDLCSDCGTICSNCEEAVLNHRIIENSDMCDLCSTSCEECGTAILLDDIYEIHGSLYCDDCIVFCCQCEKALLETDKITIDDHSYCSDCAGCCGLCHKEILKDTATSIKDKIFCQKCVFKCDSCGEILSNNNKKIIGSNQVCDICYSCEAILINNNIKEVS